jgi:hypothetical protein
MADQREITNRIGFHYYPDTFHYREKDLQTWLPELQALGAGWLTLFAHPERAIPEPFIAGLLSNHLEPILHFQLPLPSPTRLASLELLLETYARWGVRYAVLFDRPNIRRAWAPSAWTQSEVVEQFLDIYTPLAERVLQAGLTPVFPPLEPGGDYWDTTFLQAALRSLQRRGRSEMLDAFTLGALAWTRGHPLDWGAGGPERWPMAIPYATPQGSQDQLGFRIFDWYLQIVAAELGSTRPLFILRAGSSGEAHAALPDPQTHTETALEIAQALTEPGSGAADQIPPEVKACNFWLLAAAAGSPHAAQAWFQPDGSRLPAAAALRRWTVSQGRFAHHPEPVEATPIGSPTTNQAEQESNRTGHAKTIGAAAARRPHPITHYLLVPLYAWGVAEWDMESIRPIIEKFHPTVGFSIEEACLADRVTVAGGSKAFSETDLQRLREAGCSLDIIAAGGELVGL